MNSDVYRHEPLPDWLTQALKTDEVSGFKSLNALVDDAARIQSGWNKSTIRTAIDEYIGSGRLEKLGGKDHFVVRDPNGSYPIRMTEQLYRVYQEFRRHLSDEEFRVAPFVTMREALGGTHVYNAAADFVTRGLLEKGTEGRGLYKLKRFARIAVYAKHSYTDATIVLFDDVLKTESSEETAKAPSAAPVSAQSIIDRMSEIADRVRRRITILRQLPALKAAIADDCQSPEELTKLFGPLDGKYSDVEDVQALEADLSMMDGSLKAWAKYLVEEGNDNVQ
jgi:hypothetical protein